MATAEKPSGIVTGGRLAALRETGLSAVADAGMDRFARLVAGVIGVPIALVSLVESSRQILPGMVGLSEPWADTRETPLSHSLCRHVVTSGRPLVLTDARQDPLTCASPAVPDLGVIGYAGMPLTDGAGHVLGSLCAIDTRPRKWTARELELLQDLAAACSAELRLRIVSRHHEQARADEARARAEADDATRRHRAALERSRLLLRAADALADTTGLADVREQVRDLVSSDLKPVYVGLVLVEGGTTKRLRRMVDVLGSTSMERTYETYTLDAAWPTARAARENRMITVTDTAQLERDYAPEAVATFTALGLRTAVCVPLPGTVLPLGTLVLGWDHLHEIDIVEQAVLSSLAGYTARAVERALFVDSRIDVAREMQKALLTDVPSVPRLDLAALYRAAARTDLVGGDWYDAFLLPDAARGGEDSAEPAVLVLSIGDITGHDMRAAAQMGQVRSMLRQADLDHAGGGPAQAVSALEHANAALGLDASGTLIHAHLRPCRSAEAGSWELTWTNAGHPPPLVVRPDGAVLRLTRHDIMLFTGLDAPPRSEHRLLLPPGSLLMFYTDGLVERPDEDMDLAIDAAGRMLAAHAGRPLDTLLNQITDEIAGPDAVDDIALLALRVPAVRAARA
ncbi:GAF domain-containing SpoIIE family protein phosphatase [Streptomyces sp. NBC_00151]|uniref:GAF domain-containing SpoIIE family protein phosphatase n=1 Tax=Streptomyces sp. NBC_00151 TaxID=2975669 RepID=UPI002DD7E77B|nr:SpoIIE family protein phosphatase [Streptomyces sp. NBC_00151]WRZ37493.1 SpoIIE family protein phosphatase [Streptomyces sp. NBC_00151]